MLEEQTTRTVTLPAHVAEHFGVREGVILNAGCWSETYDCGALIVQRVTSQSLAHHQATVELGAHAKRALPGLSLFRGQPLACADGSFWRAASKLNGQLLSAFEDNGEFVFQTLRTLPAVSAQLRALNRQSPTAALVPWLRKGRLDMSEILSELEQSGCMYGPLLELRDWLPADLQTPALLCHGDPIPKNTILTQRGAVLIDWEMCGVMPRHFDAAHLIASWSWRLGGGVALGMAGELLGRLRLPCDQQSVLAVSAWGVMREAATWWRNHEHELDSDYAQNLCAHRREDIIQMLSA